MTCSFSKQHRHCKTRFKVCFLQRIRDSRQGGNHFSSALDEVIIAQNPVVIKFLNTPPAVNFLGCPEYSGCACFHTFCYQSYNFPFEQASMVAPGGDDQERGEGQDSWSSGRRSGKRELSHPLQADACDAIPAECNQSVDHSKETQTHPLHQVFVDPGSRWRAAN